MLLLDLPPEIFHRVVAVYVSDVGIRKAAVIRGVSKTFRDYINEEMFARQPVGKLRAKIPKRLLEKNLVLFLERRTAALHSAPSLLPSMIDKIVDYLLDLHSENPDDARADWTKKVISVIAKNSPYALSAALNPTLKMTREYKACPMSCHALAIALYLGDENLVTRLLDHNADLWGKSCLFSMDAFLLATSRKKTKLLRVLLSAAATSKSDSSVKVRSKIICECMSYALRTEDDLSATKLLAWHARCLPKLSPAASSALVHDAVDNRALGTVQALQTLGYLDNKQRPHTRDIIRGLLKDPDPLEMLTYFYNNQFISFYDLYRCHEQDQGRRLIEFAVHEDNLPLAKAVFEVAGYLPREGAFREAISGNNVAMVRLFLKNGTDPEGVISFQTKQSHKPPLRSTCELARPGSEVYAMVREAVEKKVRRQGARYVAPSYWVWSAKEQKDVLVAYTFHAPQL